VSDFLCPKKFGGSSATKKIAKNTQKFFNGPRGKSQKERKKEGQNLTILKEKERDREKV